MFQKLKRYDQHTFHNKVTLHNCSLNSTSFLQYSMEVLARIGATGEAIAVPFIWS